MKASFGKTKASVVFKSYSSSIRQSCLTFPTGTALTYPKHNFMRGWKGMNYVSHSVAESWIFGKESLVLASGHTKIVNVKLTLVLRCKQFV